MSFEINWHKITNHDADRVKNSLQEYLNSSQLPDWISYLHIDGLSWGSEAPTVEIVDVTEPMEIFRTFPHFAYQQNPPSKVGVYPVSTSSDSSVVDRTPGDSPTRQLDPRIMSPLDHPTFTARPPNPYDTQLLLNIEYSGNLSISLTTEFALNMPAPSFISLPVAFKLVQLKISVSLAIVWIGTKCHACILTPACGLASVKPFTLAFETQWEVGNPEQPVLKNATKIEKFLHEVIHKYVHDHLLYPKYHSFELFKDSEIVDEDLD